MPSNSTAWPHAPEHRLGIRGTYMVTASTLHKQHHFRTRPRLEFLHEQLLETAKKHGWALEAWAVFSNHYHFIGQPPSTVQTAEGLSAFISELHSNTGRFVNARDGLPGRQVWHNYRESILTYEKSYFARLNYTHQNAVRHKLAVVANQYSWCSAAWFESVAKPGQVKTIYRFKTDRLNVVDDFSPILEPGEE